MAYALGLLARQAYSQQQLLAQLRRRALPETDCERVIARLKELKLLDDPRFAANYLRSRRDQHGKLALRQALLHKGVDAQVVEAALLSDEEQPLDDAQQLSAARTLLAKHAWRFPLAPPGPNPQPAWRASARRRGKAMAFLARRGFAIDVASSAVDSVFSDDTLTP